MTCQSLLCKFARFVGGISHIVWANAPLDRGVKETEPPTKRANLHLSAWKTRSMDPVLFSFSAVQTTALVSRALNRAR